MSNRDINQAPSAKPSGMDRFLNFIEREGNKIPDSAILSLGISYRLGFFRSTL